MLRLLVGTRFQVLFHSAPAVLFTFPSRYSSLSVAKSYLALGGGPPRFPRGFSCPAVLGYRLAKPIEFRLRDSHPLWSAFPDRLATHLVSYFAAALQHCISQPLYPRFATAVTSHTNRVWALPRSLATTCGITLVFSSSGYLDVSVPLVTSTCLCIQHAVLAYDSQWVPPFGHPRIKARLQLPVAFRCSPRPSSALGA